MSTLLARHFVQGEVKPYILLIYWRGFTWNLRGLAQHPADLHGVLSAFGDGAPITLKIAPAWKL